MGNVPSESNMGDSLRCYKCNIVLPPCTTFNDLYQTTIHGVYVHVFNGGEYFREVGRDNMYQCKHCFYQPIRDQERRQEEERRRQEEEKRRQEEERKRRQEEERRRQEEEKRRQEEERKRRQEEELKRKRQEEERRGQEERKRQEEERRRQEERKRQEEERRRLEEERRRQLAEWKRRLSEWKKKEEERKKRQEEERRRQEEERRRQEEERRRQEEERRRQLAEWKKRQEEERRRQEEEWKKRQEEERRRQEEKRRRQEEERRRQEEERRRQEEERKRQEEEWKKRQEEERKRQEEKRRRQEEERRRQEEERRRQEEERKRQEEERKRQEEERKRQEEERRREAEEKRREKLNQRLQDSLREAEEQREEQFSSTISEDLQSKRQIVKTNLDEFEVNDDQSSSNDELLEILSSRCNIPLQTLSLSELTAQDLRSVLSVLDTLLFDEWISALPSLSTLQHTQVFLTELCALSVELSEEVSLQNISIHVQQLVDSISQSASNVFESFLLSQALYLTLMHFFTEYGDSDVDAVLIAKQWAEDELSTDQVFIIEFLSSLISSLHDVVGRASVFILKIEIKSLKLLLSTLTNLGVKETHSECTKMILGLVKTNQWSPMEAVTLLGALSQKYAEEDSICKVLTLVQVYDLSPEWTDESGHSLIQALDSTDPERFKEDLQNTLRRRDESSLSAALAELKMLWDLDDSVLDLIKNITTNVLHSIENTSEVVPLQKGHTQGETLDTEDVQKTLFQLCKAVFDTKGWWPTMRTILRWCALVLSEKSAAFEPLGLEADPCVTAMFAARQVLMGNKMDIVLSSDGCPEKRAEEWSDFFKHLGMSVSSIMKKTEASVMNIYEVDVVYGTADAFFSDYIQHGLELMETENPQHSRGFVFEGQSPRFSQNLDLSGLKGSDSQVLAAKILQSIVDNFHSDDEEERHRFMKALFLDLHTNRNKEAASDIKILSVFEKITGKQLSSTEVFILTFLERLLKEVPEERESEKHIKSSAGKWCLEILFDSVQKFEPSTTVKDLLQMVSGLTAQRLWSPVEGLSLLKALTDHHHDKDCINIMKILHLMTTYQVSSRWTDDNNQSLLNLLDSCKTKDLIQHLEKSLQGEKIKSTDALFEEIRQMKDIDDQMLDKSYAVVTHVRNLINTGEIEKHTDVQKAKSLSHSRETQDLQEVLAVLCNAVYRTNAPPYKEGKGWWPRDTQMISWCLLALSDTGRLLEMGTGEGKSCAIAMFAALHVMRGEKVDVVSSSSVLCQRDTEEWRNFYELLGMTVDTNTNKTEDEERKKCYQREVVYGTIEAFAADHLRQIFEMKDVRPERRYQCIIIDEVDSLLLDQGVQLTYLSSPMVSMEHLNTVLALIWGYVSQYGFLSAAHQTFVRSPPASFFKAIFDSMDTEGSEIKDPIDILRIAEETNTVKTGLTEEILNSNKDGLLQKLKTVSQDAMVNFFQEIEDYVPYGFTVYTLDDKGLLCLRKRSPYNQDVPELKFLVLDEGMCCTLYDSEDDLIKPIAELISQKVQYTPCSDNKDKISIPGFLNSLIGKKVSVWVQNAFLAMQLREGREYVVQNDSVCPVDFRSTGIIELNKKWGDGLQQFVEIKHKIKLSTISIVTNYVSNISFFEMYGGKIYGTTGTLGTRADIQFLQTLYPTLSACKMPTFNRRKLFEVKGTLTTSAEEWKSEIKRVVMEQISSNSHREGRAALVICETINEAEAIYEELKSSIPGEIILYCRSDHNSLSKIEKELIPGDVVVATNLAGRGTDIKVSKSVNQNGGLFVVLSFLSENTRVELQAFGRTARKGKPGSAQIIMSTEHLQPSFRTSSSLEEAKSARDRLSAENTQQMMNDVAELRLREELFSEYCKTLQEINADTDGEEKRAVVAIMNEFWGVWLQIKSEEIDQLKRNELQESLKADLLVAKSQCQSQTSPCSSIYHYIKFGNITLGEKKWSVSSRLFEKAIQQDESWAAIAFYSRAYCTIMQKNEDYLTKAIDDLKKAQESLKYLTEESIVVLQVVKMSSPTKSDQSSLEKQFLTKQEMFMCLDKNITEAINMLEEIKKEGRNAIAKKSPISSLVTNSEEALQVEAYNLFRRGLHYVFAVEKEPRFPWEALLVFLLGALQIIGGALLTAFTCGTFAQVGMGLIIEGISDCIYAVESMVTGEFSWKSWAIEKAISIGISLIGFGVGKLIAKGFTASKAALKAVGKQLKSMPKFLTRQAKDGLSVVARTNMKNAVKHTAKKIVEETIIYGLQKGEEELLKQMLQSIENKVKEGIDDDVKSRIETKELGSLVDFIILSHVDDKEQLQDLLKDKWRKTKLLSTFTELSNAAIQPFTADLSLQNKLNSSIYKVIEKAKAEVKGKVKGILTAIQAAHMTILAAESTAAALSLSSKFFTNFETQLSSFKDKKDSQEKEKKMNLSPPDTELLKGFKQELADSISRLLAAALVEVFHQKFSSHMVSIAQSKAHQAISGLVRTDLKSDRTDELLRAGQNSSYIAHMPTSKQHPTREASERSKSYAEKIKDSMTPGTLLDARVMSETTGTKVVILTEDSRGRLTTRQKLSPSTKPARQTVTLIYRPKSEQYPDGHYDVLINNKIVKIDSKDKNCLFHAMARGMKPDASEAEITEKAGSLRRMEADALLKHPGRWDSFIERKELTQSIRGGDWFMAEGAMPPKKIKNATKKLLKKEVGKVELYKTWNIYKTQNPGLGQIINADHQPPVSSILEARTLNQNSKLAEAMLEVATNSSPLDPNLIPNVHKNHGRELPTVYVPKEVHREFPSTKTQAFRKLLANAIANDKVVDTFKLTIIGSMMRSDLDNSGKYKSLQNIPKCKTRCSAFEDSFQQHSTEMVQTWYNQVNGKGVMTKKNLNTITAWINKKGYNDQNDPHRNQVSNLL